MKSPPLHQSRAPLNEASTEGIIAVLKMRASEGDKKAARALKITLSKKAKKHV